MATGDVPERFPLSFGLNTFGDRNGDADGKPVSHAQTLRNVLEEGVLAEQAGIDFFGIGEHHTDYFPMPAGDVVLAAIARALSASTLARRSRCSAPTTRCVCSSAIRP